MAYVRKDGGPAYPIWQPDMDLGDTAGPGMSLRDWFAGQVLAAVYAEGRGSIPPVVDRAYEIADAMLAERDKT